MKNKIVVVITLSILAFSCKKNQGENEPESLYVNGEEVLGGAASNGDNGSYSFEHEVSGMSIENKLAFFSGNAFFKQTWVSSPATTTARDGLGPFFNAKSCASCHPSDGRGRPPLSQSDKQQGLLLRLSTGTDEFGRTIPDPNYGGQLQDMSVQKVDVEGEIVLTYEKVTGYYSDGGTYSLRKPSYSVTNLMHGALNSETTISPRVGPQVIGLGLLEAITEEDILANADEFDADGDSISGKANYVWNVEENKLTLGRFGWKANQPTIKQQVAGAFHGDLGVTSSLFPTENCNPWLDCDTMANGGEPELTDQQLQEQELYIAALSVPIRRNYQEEAVLKGKLIFAEIGCNSCHIDEFVTGDYEVLPQLSNQTIRPYTDLLLHDMGEGLADNSPDFLATGKEWRTPPLWGIGLLKTVNGHEYLLHDGRARNIEEAVLWHGGEASRSQRKYTALSSSDRERLIHFLESL